MTKDPMFTSHDFRVDTGAIEQALQESAPHEIPGRPPVARLLQNKPTDTERAADFKERLRANLVEQAAIKDEMKREGGFDFNFQWSMDAFGRFAPGPITIFKIFP